MNMQEVENRILNLCDSMCASGKTWEWHMLDKNFVELCEIRARAVELEKEIKQALEEYEGK